MILIGTYIVRLHYRCLKLYAYFEFAVGYPVYPHPINSFLRERQIPRVHIFLKTLGKISKT
jgi:hypothetical protein